MNTRARSSLCLLLVGTTVFSPGCATILGKSANQPVDVSTEPPGARILINGIPSEQVSPATVELSPRDEHVIGAQLGQAKGQSAVRKKIRIWSVIINGILTGGLGVLVDYLTGAMYSFEPKLHLNLGVAPPPMSEQVRPQPTGTTTTTTSQTRPDAAPTGGKTRPTGSSTTTNLLDAPCPICGEPRGNKSPCPHCGME